MSDKIDEQMWRMILCQQGIVYHTQDEDCALPDFNLSDLRKALATALYMHERKATR